MPKKSIMALIGDTTFDAPAAFVGRIIYASLQHWHGTALLAEPPLKRGCCGGFGFAFLVSFSTFLRCAKHEKKTLLKILRRHFRKEWIKKKKKSIYSFMDSSRFVVQT